MPKKKTHSGAKKRFKVTGSGKLLREQASKRHLLERKPSQLHPPAGRHDVECRAGRRQEDQAAARPLTASAFPPEPRPGPSSRSRCTVARVKRAVNAQKKRRERPREGQRLPRPALAALPQGQGAAAPLRDLRLPRPQEAQGRLPPAVDHRASTRRPAPNGMTYNRFIQGLRPPASRSTARCSPTSPSTTRPRSPRSSRSPRPRCPSRPQRAGRRRLTGRASDRRARCPPRNAAGRRRRAG